MILVDTDVLIEILDDGSKKGEAALKKIEEAGEDITLTSLNLHDVHPEFRYTYNLPSIPHRTMEAARHPEMIATLLL